MLEQAAKSIDANAQEIERVGQKLSEHFGGLYAAFDALREDPNALEPVKLEQRWVEALKEIVKKSFKPKEITIKAELSISSIAGDGVERIKAALTDLEKNTGAVVKYISAPKYRVEIKTKQPKETEKMLKEALEKVAKQFNGSYEFIK